MLVLGELLVDLLWDAPRAHLTPHPGGAPANVAAQLAGRGVSVGLITAIGDDPLGHRALAELRARGVDARRVARRERLRTGLTLVEVDARGERRFTPWREGSADLTLRVDELGPLDARVLHHGTVSLCRAPARDATLAAAVGARAAGALVSVDVNLRAGMYPDARALVDAAALALERAHIVKATVDEARTLGAPAGPLAAARWFLDAGARLALITDGARPAAAASLVGAAQAQPPGVDVVDATGAGDAFFAAALAHLLERDLDLDLNDDELGTLLEIANAAGAEACAHAGALGPTARSGSRTCSPRPSS